MAPLPLDDEPVMISADDALGMPPNDIEDVNLVANDSDNESEEEVVAAAAEATDGDEAEPALAAKEADEEKSNDDDIPASTSSEEKESEPSSPETVLVSDNEDDGDEDEDERALSSPPLEVASKPATVAEAVVGKPSPTKPAPTATVAVAVVEKPLPEDELSAMPGPTGSNTSSTADAPKKNQKPSARQIVSISTPTSSSSSTDAEAAAAGPAFKFHEEELNAILSQIPPGWKVSVVSVVGAFRTGKSFLLSWFLRYLEEHSNDGTGGDEGSGAEKKDDKKWYERIAKLDQHEGSFDWRGGSARNTVGMWMWSRPYFMKDNVAVLLVDTQGMFDHETTVGLTAAIFGLSTLLSSYQIYNVDKRIQEDNLQQLALFTEYGRMAMNAEEKASGSSSSEGDASSKKSKQPPFQRIEFLVRDWQNFETEDEEDVPAMEAEMAEYLDDVLAERTATDLKDTREQIHHCFQDVGCYMLTHPGFTVAKNKYDGDTKRIEPQFLTLLDRYCHRVFGGHDSESKDGRSLPGLVEPKTIRGRQLTAVELGTYAKAYATMFEEIGAHFPKAETMLEATSKANNANAVQNSTEVYSDVMNPVAGPAASEYHEVRLMGEMHMEASSRSLGAFDGMANFGSRSGIDAARERLLGNNERAYEMYTKLNAGRNPLLGFETYILPLLIGFASFILRWIADSTCSQWSTTCRASSDLLSHVYMVVFFFMAIVATTKAQQIKRAVAKVKRTIAVLSETSPSSSAVDINKKNE